MNANPQTTKKSMKTQFTITQLVLGTAMLLSINIFSAEGNVIVSSGMPAFQTDTRVTRLVSKTTANPVVPRQTYRVPVVHKPELDGIKTQIEALRSTLAGSAGEIARIRQQAEADKAAFEREIAQVRSAWRTEAQGYEQRLQAIRNLIGQRNQQFQCETRHFQPCGYDTPSQHNAKVYAYNAAVARLNEDQQQARNAANSLLNELKALGYRAQATLAQLSRALAENRSAHKMADSLKVDEHNGTVDLANQWIDYFNGKLKEYGTLVAAGAAID